LATPSRRLLTQLEAALERLAEGNLGRCISWQRHILAPGVNRAAVLSAPEIHVKTIAEASANDFICDGCFRYVYPPAAVLARVVATRSP
jgi:hypothetical protein